MIPARLIGVADVIAKCHPHSVIGTEAKRLDFLEKFYFTLSSHVNKYTYDFLPEEPAAVALAGIMATLQDHLDIYGGYSLTEENGKVIFAYDCMLDAAESLDCHPCDFLPYLEATDPELFILVWRMLSILCPDHGEPFENLLFTADWNGLYRNFSAFVDTDTILEVPSNERIVKFNHTGVEVTEQAAKQALIDYGKGGIVSKYAWIWDDKNHSSLRRWLTTFKGFNPHTPLRRKWLKWLELGRVLAESTDKIEDYENEDYINNGGVGVKELFFFTWALNDPMELALDEDISYRMENEGYYGASTIISTEVGQKIQPPDYTYFRLLAKFYAEGRKLSQYVHKLTHKHEQRQTRTNTPR